MPIDIKVTIGGVLRFAAVNTGMLSARNKALLNLAKRVRDRAKDLVPVQTGKLKSSIQVDEKRIAQGQAVVFTASGYGAYVELGTFKDAAQPYLVPAAQMEKAAIDNIFLEAILREPQLIRVR